MYSGSIFISHAGGDDEITLIGTLVFVEGTYADVPLHTDFIDCNDRFNASTLASLITMADSMHRRGVH